MEAKTLDNTSRQLLELVRASLWHTPVDLGPFTGCPVDWDAIGRLAMQQTVAPLAVDAAMSLPPHLLPPKEWFRKGYSVVERNRRTHRLLDECVAEASSRMTEAGISAVLLKGQAYARHYPRPELRQCGDIDLYVGEEDYLRSYHVACRAGWESEREFRADVKHSEFLLRDVKIELHRIASELPSRRANRKFQTWSRWQMSPGVRSRAAIGGSEVSIPAPMFDVVFVFMHLYIHFLNGGVGLRQLCDWVMLLHAHKDIDLEELKSLLRDFRLLKAWKRLTPLAVDVMGLPMEECPFYSPRYRGKAEKILSTIMREGNFGKYAGRAFSPPPEGYLRRKLYTLRHHSRKLLSRWTVDPVTVSRVYRSYLSKGVARVMKDAVKKIHG